MEPVERKRSTHGLPAAMAELRHPRWTITPNGIFAVVAKVDLLASCSARAWQSAPPRYRSRGRHHPQDELLGVDVVDRGALALTVGAVSAGIAVDGRALVVRDAIVLQRIDENTSTAPGTSRLASVSLHTEGTARRRTGAPYARRQGPAQGCPDGQSPWGEGAMRVTTAPSGRSRAG